MDKLNNLIIFVRAAQHHSFSVAVSPALKEGFLQ